MKAATFHTYVYKLQGFSSIAGDGVTGTLASSKLTWSLLITQLVSTLNLKWTWDQFICYTQCLSVCLSAHMPSCLRYTARFYRQNKVIRHRENRRFLFAFCSSFAGSASPCQPPLAPSKLNLRHHEVKQQRKAPGERRTTCPVTGAAFRSYTSHIKCFILSLNRTCWHLTVQRGRRWRKRKRAMHAGILW